MLPQADIAELVFIHDDPRYKPRAWRPARGRKLDEGERLVRRILRTHGVGHLYERELLPLQVNVRGQVTAGICPDFKIRDPRFARQYLEIGSGGAHSLANKRDRLARASEIYGWTFHLVTPLDLLRIQQDECHLLDMLGPAEVASVAA